MSSIQYGPWHNVEIAFGAIGDPSALKQEFLYDVDHPVECTPCNCTFEDVLNEVDDSDHDGTGTFRARVVMDHYEINGTGYTSDTLEWEPAGGEVR